MALHPTFELPHTPRWLILMKKDQTNMPEISLVHINSCDHGMNALTEIFTYLCAPISYNCCRVYNFFSINWWGIAPNVYERFMNFCNGACFNSWWVTGRPESVVYSWYVPRRNTITKRWYWWWRWWFLLYNNHDGSEVVVVVFGFSVVVVDDFWYCCSNASADLTSLGFMGTLCK